MKKSITITIGDKVYDITICEKRRAHIEIRINNHVFEFPPRNLRNVVKKAMNRYPLDKDNPKIRTILAPMPGTVGLIQVAEGTSVREGQVLCLLLSMKMENEIKAPCEGRISKVLIKEKQILRKGDELFVIEQ